MSQSLATPDSVLPQPVGFINFQSSALIVMRHEGIEYIEVQPLNDLIGVHWKVTKFTAKGVDAHLYGTQSLPPPKIAGVVSSGTSASGIVCIRLDRAEMLLEHVADKLKKRGKVREAKNLRDLQAKWAEVKSEFSNKPLETRPDSITKAQPSTAPQTEITMRQISQPANPVFYGIDRCLSDADRTVMFTTPNPFIAAACDQSGQVCALEKPIEEPITAFEKEISDFKTAISSHPL
ncbi:hypothetical protein [Polaromonas naphthalenivorans]|uniref:Uncharacterized protein n=1 Tax=Polaromonas naphthalenivorans (strain CJ2) TaxID=365044 RepID=A1VSJ0_POLNA|nr:hypothetical protein [Polaromonas naphthalenivorans]ABM38618.1 hypothetical protein Pnap_3321 [Polaromonas naphthalenivorans CJ2]